MTQYKVSYYPPDGHGRTTDGPMDVDGQIFATIEEARIAVGRALGCTVHGKWSGDEERGDIEAWHESPEEGCGGYAISKVSATFGEN